MTNINFDEPSNGNVNSNDNVALAVKNNGLGIGILGENTNDVGKEGVIGKSKNSAGVLGESVSAIGVIGKSDATYGVYGESKSDIGVCGVSTSTIGVYGESGSAGGTGVEGNSTGSQKGFGVHGWVQGLEGAGVWGQSTNSDGHAYGVLGQSENKDGVRGECRSIYGSGVAAVNTGGGPGIYASGNPAGRFEGNIDVTGDLRLIGADCAEEFDVHEETGVDPGTVMVLSNDGKLVQSNSAYDKKVAGVVSGASNYKPGIILDKKISKSQRVSIALLGKVYCRVDASYSEINIGDLLTTSPSKGYAMKATDSVKSFGAIIGKALSVISEGRGLIPILVALQ